jgi:glutaredoxin-like protein NrdH
MDNEVTVYSTPDCRQCKATKRKLTELGIPFREVDLSLDASALEMVKALGYSKAPVVTVGDKHWSGYRPDHIDQLATELIAA